MPLAATLTPRRSAGLAFGAGAPVNGKGLN